MMPRNLHAPLLAVRKRARKLVESILTRLALWGWVPPSAVHWVLQWGGRRDA